MECEVTHLHDILNDDGDSPYSMILGRVRRIHVVSVIDQRTRVSDHNIQMPIIVLQDIC